MTDAPTFVTHLECSLTGDRYGADRVHGVSKAGKPLLVKYDLAALRESISKSDLAIRPPDIWRYREFLPVRRAQNIVSLGECHTPLIRLNNLKVGRGELIIKDEGRLPTGSFKARGLCIAVSMAKELGITKVAMPTNGNAGAALAAYASRAGIECYVFCSDDTPQINLREISAAGAKVWRVNGLINDCGRIVGQGTEAMGWFDFSTLKEPYRIEGKKTMGLELAEQLDWRLPDVILYPTGGGTGLIGMWKAFAELAEMGWLADSGRPRMVAVQSDGCCPIVRAFQQGTKHAEPFPNAATIASGLRVPAAVGDFMILDAVRESQGRAVAVEEGRIIEWMELIVSSEGVAACPEAAACLGALEQLAAEGWIAPDDRVVLFNTGAAQKYPEAVTCRLPRIDAASTIDWDALSAGGSP